MQYYSRYTSFLAFTGRLNIQNFYIRTSTRRLRDPLAGCPGDKMMERSQDVHEMSVIHVF